MKQNNQQRPTPETDAAEINLGSACGQFSEWYVKPDFARKLERQRDEAREQLEDMRKAIKEAYDAIEEAREIVYWDVGTFKALDTKLSKSGPALAKLQPFLKP